MTASPICLQCEALYLQARGGVCVRRPDIIHCHDWPTAPVCYGDKGPSKSVFTIHNLNFGADLIGRAMQAAQVTAGVMVTRGVGTAHGSNVTVLSVHTNDKTLLDKLASVMFGFIGSCRG